MKKIVKIVLMFVLGILMIACGVEKTEKESKDESGIASKLVIGLDDTFAPMGFKNELGEIVGFDVDLAKEAAKIIGVEIEFKSINWDAKILDLNSGNIDLIWNGLTITPDRSEQTEMSKPYYASYQGIVVLADSDISTKEDLKNKVVGVQGQSSGEEAAIKAGDDKNFKEFKAYPQYDQAFLDLDNGRIDAIVADSMLASYIKNTKEKQSGKVLYRIFDAEYGEEVTGVAAKKGRKELIEAVNNAIDELKANGKYDEIYKKWF